MTEQQLRALGPALDRFLGRSLFCCAYTQTFAHLGTYVRGLLADLPRKSAEPIALRGGTPPARCRSSCATTPGTSPPSATGCSGTRPTCSPACPATTWARSA